MRFMICVLFLVISLTLLEAVPAPQLTTIKRQPWKPKAIREKEANQAAEEAARKAEEAARKAEEAARKAEEATRPAEQSTEVPEQTTVEQTTSVEEGTTVILEQVTAIPEETTTLLTQTTTIPVEAMQDNLVANPTPDRRRIVTRRKTINLVFSAKERGSALRKKGGPIAEAAACRLSLRGVPCHCRFEGTCRCNCG